MKFNKWTIGLAAVGVVSLASAAKAEEKAASVMTALSSTTLSGYVDTSAQWNFGTGNANTPPYKFGGADKADGFNLDVIQLRLEKPLDEAEWAAGYRLDLWAGPDANTLGTQSILSTGTGDFAIRQAYVALRAPFQNGLDFKVGVFDSIIGYESVESGNNPNYTRSYGHSIEPQTHTGLLVSYRFNDMISASAGVANTIGPTINERAHGPHFVPDSDFEDNRAESYKTYMGSVAVTIPESVSFLAGSTVYAGIVNGFTSSYQGSQTSWYVGSTLATPITGLRLGAAFDYLDVHSSTYSTVFPTGISKGEAWAASLYATFQATEKLSLHGRAEYLDDQATYFTFDRTFNVVAVTATAQYDLWKNVISRAELRWDHATSGANVFGGTDEPTRRNAWMLAANIIYKF